MLDLSSLPLKAQFNMLRNNLLSQYSLFAKYCVNEELNGWLMKIGDKQYNVLFSEGEERYRRIGNHREYRAFLELLNSSHCRFARCFRTTGSSLWPYCCSSVNRLRITFNIGVTLIPARRQIVITFQPIDK